MPWDLLFKNLSSMDAVIIVQIMSILKLVVSTGKDHEKIPIAIKVLGIKWIGFLSITVIILRFIMWLLDNYGKLLEQLIEKSL